MQLLLIINHMKKYKKGEETDLEQNGYIRNLPDIQLASYEDIDLQHFVREQILSLPVHYRTVITLFYLEEFTYQEIEQITNMPEGTVKSYLFRGKAILKEKLKFVMDENSLKSVKEIGDEK